MLWYLFRHGQTLHSTGVDQLSRYMEFLSRDHNLRPVKGLYAAQVVTKQARTLCDDRNIEWQIIDYELLKEKYGRNDNL